MDTKQCTRCKYENPIAACFCRHCGMKFAEESKKDSSLTPMIKDFRVIDEVYTIGSVVKLMWNVDVNTSSLILDGQNVTHHDTELYVVKGDATLELKAYNEYRNASKKLKISPNPLPKILRFEASRKKIKAGENVKVHINCIHTVKITLTSNKGYSADVTKLKSIEITPTDNEVYTLNCQSIDPKVVVNQELRLEVFSDVNITMFKADKQETMESIPVTLKWNVKGAHSIMLYPNGIDVTRKNSMVVHPNHTIEYRLEARNGMSVKSEVLSIYVRPLPRLNYAMPDFDILQKVSSFNLNMFKIQNNLKEIDIDRWMMSPLEGKRASLFKRIINKIMNKS